MFELLIDFKKLLWQDELNPRVRCVFDNVLVIKAINIPGRRIPPGAEFYVKKEVLQHDIY